MLSGSKISSEANGGQLSLPTTPQLPLERAGTEEAGESMLGSGQWKVGVPDNDLSGPITDAPNSNDGTKPAPLQTSHSSPGVLETIHIECVETRMYVCKSCTCVHNKAESCSLQIMMFHWQQQ